MIEDSLAYLASPAALASLERDCYWPKWDSPWWHMLLLHEMGLGDQIPAFTVDALIQSMHTTSLHHFPIPKEERVPGVGSNCHCAIGNIYGVIATAGCTPEPWMRDWLSSYQMEDGGSNCDEDAYLVEGECPSSMVALVPCFEALVRHVPDWTPKEAEFVRRAADFMLNRELRLGSTSNYNADERRSAEGWLKVCFPRFYFYDVLRGLNALREWSERTHTEITTDKINLVKTHLHTQFPDGVVKPQRYSYEGTNTRGGHPASLFPLLEQTSRLDEPSPWLSRQYAAVRDWYSRL